MPGGEVRLQIGQEFLVLAANNTGAQIDNGSAVYVTGSLNERPTVALASSNTDLEVNATLGLATEDIPNGQNGFITTAGIVRNLDTSSWAAGSILYLGPTPGQITTEDPIPPAGFVKMGNVLVSDPSNGKIYVNINMNKRFASRITVAKKGGDFTDPKAAFDWANANITAETEIFIAGGEYEISGTLLFDNPYLKKVTGVGEAVTQIKPSTAMVSSPQPVFRFNYPAQISNIAIDGSDTPGYLTTPGCAALLSYASGGNTEYVYLNGVDGTGCYAYFGAFDDCEVVIYTSDIINIQYKAICGCFANVYIDIWNCYFENNAGIILAASGSAEIRARECEFVSGGTLISATGNSTIDIRNSIADTLDTGIVADDNSTVYIEDSSFNSISNLAFDQKSSGASFRILYGRGDPLPSQFNIINPNNIYINTFSELANTTYVGNAGRQKQSLFTFSVTGPALVDPTLDWRPDFYNSHDGLVYYDSNTGNNGSFVVQASSSDYFAISTDRDKTSSLHLYSDTGAFGVFDAVRGWKIRKEATTANLTFNFENDDSFGANPIVPIYPLLTLDGFNKTISIHSSGQLLFDSDTNLYRGGPNLLVTDDSFSVTGNLLVSGSQSFQTGTSVNKILDEDNMASNDPDALATQQSIKAYVDAQVFSGDTGLQGQTGTQGLTGFQGTTGFQGVTGILGVDGQTGIQGVTGILGVDGQTGIQGVTGILGLTGIKGDTGDIGETGVRGVTGAYGGPKGDTGIQGNTGIRGITGIPGGGTGLQGPTGGQGVTGLASGPKGATGIQGITGFIGFTGLYGLTGYQGVTGLGTTGTIEKQINQPGHNFSVGMPIYYNSSASNYGKARADNITTLGVFIVSSVIDINNFKLTQIGYVNTFAGLSAGNYYFVSDATSGALTTIEPTASGSYSNPILLAISATEGFVLPYRASESSVDSNALAYQTVTSNYNIQLSDDVIGLDGTSNTVVATLPTAVGNDGEHFTIKALDITYNVGVTTLGGETIDGQNNFRFNNKYEAVHVLSDGSNWLII